MVKTPKLKLVVSPEGVPAGVKTIVAPVALVMLYLISVNDFPSQTIGTVVPLVASKTIVASGLTVTSNVWVVAQTPDAGVKVYVPEVVLLNAGDQVPEIGVALLDTRGKVKEVSPRQIEAEAGVKVGTVGVVMVIVFVIAPGVTHCPAVGLKV